MPFVSIDVIFQNFAKGPFIAKIIDCVLLPNQALIAVRKCGSRWKPQIYHNPLALLIWIIGDLW